MDAQTWIDLSRVFIQENPEFGKFFSFRFPNYPVPEHRDTLKFFCYTITYQAISTTVCNKMWQRFEQLMASLGHKETWPAEIVFSLSDDQLKNFVKLSTNKADAVRGIAAYIAENPEVFDSSKTSSEIVRSFKGKVKGVGPFTIKYFLFNLGRFDIAMNDDLVFRKGLGRVYKLPKTPTVKEAEAITNKWTGLQSVGSGMCYHIAHL